MGTARDAIEAAQRSAREELIAAGDAMELAYLHAERLAVAGDYAGYARLGAEIDAAHARVEAAERQCRRTGIEPW